ncbi:MAG TPA: hypothetical protein ENI23_16515 [bacterium]|nr:hypothetical protein [bacterium]
MPNAKDAKDIGKPKFLLLGSTGSGKTAQILTLPGKTFCYLFDPSALATLKGHDIDYELFLPTKVSTAAVSLSKGKSDPIKEEDASLLYVKWEKDSDERTKPDKKKYGIVKEEIFTPDNPDDPNIIEPKGQWKEVERPACWFDQFDNICFDSFTTFSDMVMDRILKLNGRAGQFPQQDDWGGQMQTITNVVRTYASMNKILLFTAHEEFKQDKEGGKMQNMILLTGRLRVKLPLLFSEMLHMECASTPAKIKYQIQTRPDRYNPAIRTTIKGLEMFHDVTISDWTKPKDYGLGKLLRGTTK